jgi:hypothetical protein
VSLALDFPFQPRFAARGVREQWDRMRGVRHVRD